jgi:hypothetical protein
LWDRVGRFVLTMEEWVKGRYQSSEEMANHLPFHSRRERPGTLDSIGLLDIAYKQMSMVLSKQIWVPCPITFRAVREQSDEVLTKPRKLGGRHVHAGKQNKHLKQAQASVYPFGHNWL